MNSAKSTTEPALVVVDRIPSIEESLLEWYFGPAQALFERSTCGAMLERLDADRMVSTECKACGGKGILDETDITPANQRCVPCDGPRCDEPHQQRPACQWCWMGSGEVKEGCWCRRCRGTGWTAVAKGRNSSKITVRPKSTSGAGFEVDDIALRKYAKISRRVNELYENDRENLNILAAYYGFAGLRFGRDPNNRRGRIVAVYALTPSGQKLVKRGQKFGLDNGETLMAYQIVENEIEANKLSPDRNRSALIDAADEQARKLIKRAAIAWNLTRPIRRAQ
jgi:hypothetical protein